MKNIVHITCSNFLHKELLSKGIFSYVIPIVPYTINLDITTMPNSHAVLAYVPKGKEDFYMFNVLNNIARLHPSIKFYIVANDGKHLNSYSTNIYFLGTLSADEMNEIYKKVSILFRIIKHDGLSMMLLESLAKGKQVIYMYDFPYICKPNNLSVDEINKTFDDIVKHPPHINYLGHEYVVNNYNKGKILNLYNHYEIFK